MSSVASEGRTVLFVSHNMGAVSALCPRSVVIEEGRAVYDGPTESAIALFLVRVHGEGASRVQVPRTDRGVEIRERWIEGERGAETGEVDFRTDSTLVLRYEVKERTRDVTMAVLVAVNGQPLFYTYDTDNNADLREWREAGWYEARVQLPTASLKEGNYTVHGKIGAGREDLTDPRATVSVSIVNTAEDLTHKSYRSDRPGLLVAGVDWQTRATDGIE
jgi:lipopolysaccharide transport system ATP-binding protein